MREGLLLIQLPGRYGYSVTRVGRAKRVQGDEWEFHNARSVVRSRGRRTLGQLAAEGPKDDHECFEMEPGPELLHRLLVRRAMPADEKAWGKLCPPLEHK